MFVTISEFYQFIILFVVMFSWQGVFFVHQLMFYGELVAKHFIIWLK